MSDSLTARQTQILKSIVDEYIETADAVGSSSIEKKYELGVSPATIRSEMAQLSKKGYLKQLHTSAGRVPTPKAMKFYVDTLMEEKQMSLTDEVKTKEEVWDSRNNLYNLLEEATHSLAERTGSLAVCALDGEDRLWHSGYSNVFSYPEFVSDLGFCSEVFSFIEEVDRFHDLLFKRVGRRSPFDVIFGEEIGWPGLAPMGIVASPFKVGKHEGVIGVVGPMRLNYGTIVPITRKISRLIEEVAKEK